MSEFFGADTDQLRTFAHQLTTRSATVAELRNRLDPLIRNESSWSGPDAEQFRADWNSRGRTQFDQVTERLRTWSTTIAHQAAEQDTTSNSLGSGTGAGGPGGAGPGKGGGPSFWDRLTSVTSSYNSLQSLFTKSKKAWELTEISARYMRAMHSVSDPLVKAMALPYYGKEIADKVNSSGKEYGKFFEKLAAKSPLPSGFGPKNFFSGADRLLSKAPFLKTAAPLVGKYLPVLDIGLGSWQAYSSAQKGDDFHTWTGGAQAAGGGLMMLGAAMSATGVGAVAGGPIAAFGAALTLGAAGADLIHDYRGEIADTANSVKDTVSDAASSVKDTVSDVGEGAKDAVSGAWNSVFG